MVDLVRAGRSPDDLAREFEPSGHSIRAWVAQVDRNEGRREEAAPGLTAFAPSFTLRSESRVTLSSTAINATERKKNRAVMPGSRFVFEGDC